MVLYINDVCRQRHPLARCLPLELGAESGSAITLAEGAIVIAEPAQATRLHLNSGTTHEFQRENPDQYSFTAFERSDWPIEFTSLDSGKFGPQQPRTLAPVICGTIAAHAGATPRVELYQRLRFPLRVLAFAP